MKAKHLDRTWFGFDHEKVNNHFLGDLTFKAEADLNGRTWAIYHVANPDRSLGHKDYLLLSRQGQEVIVSGMDADAMEILRWVQGIACLNCNTAMYSVHRHDGHGCSCSNNAFVDGGSSYLRWGAVDFTLVAVIWLDLLTGETYDANTGEILISRLDNKEQK